MNIITQFLGLKLAVIILASLQDTVGAYRGVRRGLHHNLHYLDPPGEVNLTLTKDEWFEQRLDHFNAQNTKTWKQRYFSR